MHCLKCDDCFNTLYYLDKESHTPSFCPYCGSRKITVIQGSTDDAGEYLGSEAIEQARLKIRQLELEYELKITELDNSSAAADRKIISKVLPILLVMTVAYFILMIWMISHMN